MAPNHILRDLYVQLLTWMGLGELDEAVKTVIVTDTTKAEPETSSPAETGPTLRSTAYISDVGRRGADYKNNIRA